MTGHITGDSRKRLADQTPRMTPGESTDSGRVAELLKIIRDAYLYPIPTHSIVGVPEAIIASDWLADVVAQAKAEALAPFEALFSGGPDTPCRTQWREAGGGGWPDQECVVVPMADLQDAFRAAREATS